MWKYLRIAVTAISLLVCVLLIALWVRSYWRTDYSSITLRNSARVSYRSRGGGIEVLYSTMQKRAAPTVTSYSKSIKVSVTREAFEKILATSGPSHSIFRFEWHETYFLFSAPYWFYLAIIAALLWIKWRFSLRTLLIVMTLFALFFGAIAMSIRG